MKKLLFALLLVTATQAAPALSIGNYVGVTGHETPYHAGYRHGKHDAYSNVARTVVIVGFAVIVGVAIYHLGKESRWTTNENGIAYRF